jgi:hypothetical protein
MNSFKGFSVIVGNWRKGKNKTQLNERMNEEWMDEWTER